MGAFLMKVLVGSMCILGAAFSRQLSDEFKAWTPWLVERIVMFAARKLPEDHRARYSEEWSSHVGEIPGQIGKVLTALGFYWAAISLNSELHELQEKNRTADIAVSIDDLHGPTLGLLPEPEGRAGSFFVSLVCNGLVCAMVLFIGMTARPQLHRPGIRPASENLRTVDHVQVLRLR